MCRAVDSAPVAVRPGDDVFAVDDGSPDDTGQVAEAVRVPLERVPHAVVSAARNGGVHESRAPLMTFLDSADEWRPDKLQPENPDGGSTGGALLRQRLRAREARRGRGLPVLPDLAPGPARLGGASARRSRTRRSRPQPEGRKDFPDYVSDLYPTHVRGDYVCTCTVVVPRKKAAGAVQFPEGLRRYEGWEWVPADSRVSARPPHPYDGGRAPPAAAREKSRARGGTQPEDGLAPKADMKVEWFQADDRVIRVLGAIARWSGRGFGFEAADIMAARVSELRRLDRLPRAFAVRPALPSDEAALGSLMGDPAKARRLLASGDIGLLAIAGGEVQAMEWVRPGPSEYDWDARRLGVVFRVPPRCCWLHNGQDGEEGTVGPWAMILGRMPSFLDERGIEAAFLQVGCENQYSRRCHESLGFRRRGRIVTLRFGRWRFPVVRREGGRWARPRGRAVDLQQVSP